MNKKLIITEHQFNRLCKEMQNYPSLKEIYEGNGNESEMIKLSEANAKRLIDRHSQNGYAIISACRGKYEFGLGNAEQDTNRLNQINAQRIKELVSDIQKQGFSYTLSYGGFIENQGTEEEENVYERSVIVYAEKMDGSAASPKELFGFAIAECKKFNQDSVLVKLPNENPKYFRKDGSVDYEFTGDIAFNDITKQYFTDLHKNTEQKIKNNTRPTRFSFTESYIAPKPQCYSESHVRTLKGEKFLLK